jgi:hypothetical protein
MEEKEQTSLRREDARLTAAVAKICATHFPGSGHGSPTLTMLFQSTSTRDGVHVKCPYKIEFPEYGGLRKICGEFRYVCTTNAHGDATYRGGWARASMYGFKGAFRCSDEHRHAFLGAVHRAMDVPAAALEQISNVLEIDFYSYGDANKE